MKLGYSIFIMAILRWTKDSITKEYANNSSSNFTSLTTSIIYIILKENGEKNKSKSCENNKKT